MKREPESHSQDKPNNPLQTPPGLRSLRLENVQSELPYTHERIIEKLVVTESPGEEPERWDGMA